MQGGGGGGAGGGGGGRGMVNPGLGLTVFLRFDSIVKWVWVVVCLTSFSCLVFSPFFFIYLLVFFFFFLLKV